MIPFAPPIFEAECHQLQRRMNRLALGLFALTALVSLVVKYLP
jgi:hypothetical protein